MCYKEKILDQKIKIKEIYFTEIKYNKVKGWINTIKYHVFDRTNR